MLDKALTLIYAGKSDDDMVIWYNNLSPDERAQLDCELVASLRNIREAWQAIQDRCIMALEIVGNYFAEYKELIGQCQHLENE